MLTPKTEKLALMLFETQAVKFGSFRLKIHDTQPDAPLSPIYIDLRLMRSFPEVMAQAIEVYRELISSLKYDLMADLPTSATPTVAILTYLNKIPMISPRKDEKSHGLGRKIDGVFKKGQTVLLVDDLITHAESKFEGIKVLEEQGLTVKDIVVLIDREQGGSEQIKKAGYFCHSAMKISELLHYYVQRKKITAADCKKIIEYIRTNQ
jgi:orotate phosphoribosyltransferase